MKNKIAELREHVRRVKEGQEQKNVVPVHAKPAPKPGKEEDGITIKSSTPGSNKRFKITVDDNGVISAVEAK